MQACLNGTRMPGAHPCLPITAADLAADAVAVMAAGATSIHIHVKDGRGRDTLTAGPLDAALTAIRDAAPGLPVGVTTGAWAQPLADARVALIDSWRELPDFASVNWHEDGAERVARTLLARGVAVEAGLWSPQDVSAWGRSGIRQECVRVLLELPARDETVTCRLADFLLAQLDEVGMTVPVLLHGESDSAWPAVRHAVARGLETRMGLEDTMESPDGIGAQDNADLVAVVVRLSAAPD